MKQYLDLLKLVLDKGVEKENRTGVKTLSIFGAQARFDLKEGFPLLTTKKMQTKSIIHELLWFLKGDTNIKYLNDNGVHIWDEWADENGDLGPIYGRQWRRWNRGNEIVHDDFLEEPRLCADYIDQIAQVIHQLRTNPDDRRIIVSAWNVGQLEAMRLPPCHCLFQFWTRPGDKLSHGRRYLSCQLYQRSCDLFLGVPFNIASYAMLTHIIAHVVDMVPDEFIHTYGDLHIYENHLDQVATQLKRAPYRLPHFFVNRETDNIDEITADDLIICDYQCYPAIKAPIAV